MKWNQENTDRLISLWKDETLSLSDIARTMKLTKNTILSKGKRLDLPSRERKKVLKQKDRKARSKERPDAALGKSLEKLEPNECRWPIGDRDFCAHPTLEGKVYCETHYRIAYVKRESAQPDRSSCAGEGQTCAD